MSRLLLPLVALAAMSQVSTVPAPLAGTPMPDPNVGRASQARVLIINKDPRTEAIPVAVSNTAEPIRVALTGNPAVSVTGAVTAVTQAATQRWEYRVVAIAAGVDPTSALNGAGNDGWEAIAVAARPDGTSGVILKRPR